MKKILSLLAFVTLFMWAESIAPAIGQSQWPSTEPNHYTHITTNTTTTITGAHVLVKICINTKGASANTATVDDQTSATTPTVAVIDTTAATGCFDYNVGLSNGLTIVTATGTAPDITVAWK